MTRFMLIAPVAVVGLLLMMIVLMAPPSYLSATNGAGAEGAPISVEGIPPDYLALYWKADQEYDIDWAILAAIGSIESDHGRSTLPGVRSGQNAYGCCAGPMQFQNNPAFAGGGKTTWDVFRVDGDKDGDHDIYDPVDAIPAAASYLLANVKESNSSTPAGKLRDAIYRYNHSDAYVKDVLRLAQTYRETAEYASPGLTESRVQFTGDLVPVPRSLAKEAGMLIDAGVLPMARRIVDEYGLVISSAHRPPAHNAIAGGVSGSDHLCGLGVDFFGDDYSSMVRLERWGRERLARGELPWVDGPELNTDGKHGDHVHISFARCSDPRSR